MVIIFITAVVQNLVNTNKRIIGNDQVCLMQLFICETSRLVDVNVEVNVFSHLCRVLPFQML